MRCLPFTLRIEGDYSCEVKSNDRIRRGLKSNRRECLNCGQEHMKSAGHAHKSFKSRRRESVTSRQNPFGNSGALLSDWPSGSPTLGRPGAVARALPPLYGWPH
jgi:hypothetical protein